MSTTIRQTYNFAPSFCFFVPKYAADMLSRDYWNDTFDLSDIDVHNCIEHDASLTRQCDFPFVAVVFSILMSLFVGEDSIKQRDQGKPSVPLVNELLACGTGPNGDLTAADLARISGKRRSESKRSNGQFSITTFQKFFGSSK